MAKVMDRLTEIFNKTGQPVSVIIKGNGEYAYIGVDMKNHPPRRSSKITNYSCY